MCLNFSMLLCVLPLLGRFPPLRENSDRASLRRLDISLGLNFDLDFMESK